MALAQEERARLVELARGWIGTPYVAGAQRRGAGCDCLGFILGLRAAAARDFGRSEAKLSPVYPADWAERGAPERLAEGLGGLMAQASGEALGQVVLFRLMPGRPAGHLGLLSALGERPRFIHTYDRHGVCESPLSPQWARRIVARFELL